MKKLFDASAIILLAKNNPQEVAELLKNNFILDLTVYEIGNTIWKLNKILKNEGRDIAVEAIKQAQNLLALMDKCENAETLISIMDNAFQYNLTYYDSAYLTAADDQKLALITEDKKLEKAASNANIHTYNIEEMLESSNRYS